MSRPLIENHEPSSTSGDVTTTGYTGGYKAGGNADHPAPNPIDQFFAGTRWRREDIVFAMAVVNLLLVLVNVYTAGKVTQVKTP